MPGYREGEDMKDFHASVGKKETQSYPLTGIRVIALEQAVAAPLASRHLADLGADVIKIERPGEGDFARRYDSSVHGLSSYFTWLNRAKRSLALDFKQPAGTEILQKLLDGTDVFITNLTLAALQRAGLSKEVVQANRPRLIYCTISGYGDGGPYRDRKAYDLLLQGESGLLAATGSPQEPAKVGVSLCDISAGMYAAMATLGALVGRRNTGQGTSIDISLLESAAEWMGSPLYYYLGTGQCLARTGMRHSLIVPYGPYRCGDGQYLNLAIQNEREWLRFCELVLEHPALAKDSRFARNEERLAHRETLEPIIEGIFNGFTRSTLIERLKTAEIAWGDVNDISGLAAHPQLRARAHWSAVEVNGHPFQMLNHPMNLAEMPQRTDPVPSAGQHSEEILNELGYDAAAIATFRQAKVI